MVSTPESTRAPGPAVTPPIALPLVLPVQTANAEFVGTVRKGDQSLIGVSSTYDVKMKAEGNKGAGVTPVSLKPVREGVPMFAPKGTTEAKNIFQQNDPVIKK